MVSQHQHALQLHSLFIHSNAQRLQFQHVFPIAALLKGLLPIMFPTMLEICTDIPWCCETNLLFLGCYF